MRFIAFIIAVVAVAACGQKKLDKNETEPVNTATVRCAVGAANNDQILSQESIQIPANKVVDFVDEKEILRLNDGVVDIVVLLQALVRPNNSGYDIKVSFVNQELIDNPELLSTILDGSPKHSVHNFIYIPAAAAEGTYIINGTRVGHINGECSYH